MYVPGPRSPYRSTSRARYEMPVRHTLKYGVRPRTPTYNVSSSTPLYEYDRTLPLVGQADCIDMVVMGVPMYLPEYRLQLLLLLLPPPPSPLLIPPD